MTNNQEPLNKPKRTLVALLLAFTILFGVSVGMGMTAAKSWFFPESQNVLKSKENQSTSDSATEETSTEFVGYNEGSEERIVRIVDQVAPSLVAITSKVYYRDFMNNTSVNSGAGSGIVFKIDETYIYLLTNNHVIEDTNDLVVEFYTGVKAKGILVGSDKMSDLAIVKVDKKEISESERIKIKPIALGNSDQLKVGQTAIAIGNPLNYGTSVTVGVISALHRQIDATGNESMIQTDAAINPGNSGGALVNSTGQLVGINTVKIAETSVEGIGFSIPVNRAKPIIDELFSKGYVSRPYLGIYGQVIDAETSSYYNVPVGILVMGTVAGSGAERSGVQKGDIIVSIDSTKMNDMNDLTNHLKNKKIGEKVILKIFRENKMLSKEVILTEQKSK